MFFVDNISYLRFERGVLEQIRVNDGVLFDIVSAVGLNRAVEVDLIIVGEIGELANIGVEDLIKLCLHLAERNEVLWL